MTIAFTYAGAPEVGYDEPIETQDAARIVLANVYGWELLRRLGYPEAWDGELQTAHVIAACRVVITRPCHVRRLLRLAKAAEKAGATTITFG